MNSDLLQEFRKDTEVWPVMKKFPDELRSRTFGLREIFDDRLLRRELSLSPGFFQSKASKERSASDL
jgi:hypothetical protein